MAMSCLARVLIGCTLLACLLVSTEHAATAENPKRVLLLGQGPDGHPPQTHEYVAGLERLANDLKGQATVVATLVQADEPWSDGPELLRQTDVAVLFLAEGAKWASADPRRYAALTELASRGGGLVALHWAIGTRQAEPIAPFVRLFGGCHGGPDRKYQVVDAELRPAADHPVLRGMQALSVRDEFYYRLKFTDDKQLEPLLTVRIDGNDETVAWAWQRPDGGRSFGFSGLHFHDNLNHPEYRRLMAQAVLWGAGVEIPAPGIALPGE
jgi:type 1 glutamine amidotransferase